MQKQIEWRLPLNRFRYIDLKLPIKVAKDIGFIHQIQLKTTMKIPGLSFSWKMAPGTSQVKQQLARQTGIPTTQAGIERKIGRAIIKGIFGK